MYSTRVLLSLAALAGTSLSQKSDKAYCDSVESSYFATVFAMGPTTPAAILSFVATETAIPALGTTFDPSGHQDQLCAIATALPSSLLPAFQDFASKQLEFGEEQNPGFVEYITDCSPAPKASSLISYLDHVYHYTGNICTESETASASATPTVAPGSGASNGTQPTGTGSAYPTATGSSSSPIPTAAAARPTGALIGVAAVGGVLGAVALL
ncbi:hypothetical protein F4808DRAFT_84733 [Astrocystis sublimbata]|nr:hypothetical protein F4808DRAFT_84733 [Astrocystis sublimbata]